MNKIVKNAIILTIITLVSGIGLGFVYEITKEPMRPRRKHGSKCSLRRLRMILKRQM